jgi:hypothetical protein
MVIDVDALTIAELNVPGRIFEILLSGGIDVLPGASPDTEVAAKVVFRGDTLSDDGLRGLLTSLARYHDSDLHVRLFQAQNKLAVLMFDEDDWVPVYPATIEVFRVVS